MTRGENRARVDGRRMFNHLGMPISRLESSPRLRIEETPPQRAGLGRNPNIEVRISSQRSQFTTGTRRYDQQERGTILSNSCNILGSLLRKEQSGSSAKIHREDNGSLATLSEGLQLHYFGTTAQWVTPVKTINGLSRGALKTLACIREKGAEDILMSAQSGWLRSGTSGGNLLDSETWTKAVREFCSLLEHRLPAYPIYDREYPGQFHACHVEKRLILYFVCHFLSDGVTGILDEKKLQQLKQRVKPLVAILTITKAPCDDCIAFRNAMEELTGILFQFEVCPVLGQTETFKQGTATHRRLVPQGVKLKLFRNIGQSKGTNGPKKQQKRAVADMRRKQQPSASTYCQGASTIAGWKTIIQVLIPSRATPQQAAKSLQSSVKKATLKVILTTPPRATRLSGLFTPPPSPFSFDGLNQHDRKRSGRRGSRTNPLIVAD